ncbi:Uncharacterised protein [uncultured archaeon]|nr:Uncharacterised protein [uncultured archaeon]
MRTAVIALTLTLVVLACGCDKSPVEEAVNDAIKANDPSLCEKNLADQPQPQEKIDSCLKSVASQTNSTAACALLKDPENREPCVSIVAANKKDFSVCDELNDSAQNKACMAKVGLIYGIEAAEAAQEKAKELYDAVYGKGAYCEREKDDFQKAECLLKSALKYKDPDVCAKIDAEEKANNCRQAVAYSFSDNNACKKITNQDLQKTCSSEVAFKLSMETGTVEFCKKLPPEDADKCIALTAMRLARPGFCDQLNNQTTRMNCIKEANDAATLRSITQK